MREMIKKWQRFRVHAIATSEPNRASTEREVENYDVVVCFNSAKDHESVTKEYLKYYLRVDPDSHDSKLRGLSTKDNICAEALATYFLRDITRKCIDAECMYDSYVKDLPLKEPTVMTDTYAIWYDLIDRRFEHTEYSIAELLLDTIRQYGKISCNEAREIIKSKFGENASLTNDVLDAFSEMGGKFTKKYLRL